MTDKQYALIGEIVILCGISAVAIAALVTAALSFITGFLCLIDPSDTHLNVTAIGVVLLVNSIVCACFLILFVKGK